MTNWNKKLTIEEARKLSQFKGSVSYIDNKWNRLTMAIVVDEIVAKIHGNEPLRKEELLAERSAL